MDWLDDLWGDLLSEEPLRIIAVWVTLDAESQTTVHQHLERMTSEDGYADSQRESARTALAVIDEEAAADLLAGF